MKKKIILSTLLFALVVGGCKKDNNNSSSSNTYNAISSVESTTSNSTTSINLIMPSEAIDFVLLVNSIVINEEAGIYIDEAWDLYDALGDNWNYPEVLEAYYKLLILEELYNDYIEVYNEALDFIEKVESIPYLLNLSDERYIIAAESAYEKLSDDAKEIIGVSQAYERLLEARKDYDELYAQSIEEERQETINDFLALVNNLPSLEELTVDNYEELSNALTSYELLSDDIKEETEIIDAYNKLLELEEKYNDLLNITITLNSNGGVCDIESIEAISNETIGTLPTPIRDGYKFLGWYTEGGEEVTSTSTFKVDTTIYAQWKEIVDVVVTLDTNGGICDIETIQLTNEQTIGTLPTPTKEGYRFLGWYTDIESGDKIISSSIFEENTTIYAHWEDEDIVHNVELTNAYLDTYMNNHTRLLWDKSVLGNVDNSMSFSVVINYNGVDYNAKVIDWLKDWGTNGAYTGIGIYRENCPVDFQNDSYTITVTLNDNNGTIYSCTITH